MNYLTNYYKNLSEQLQERINLLEAQIYDTSAKVASGNWIQQRSGQIDATKQGLKRQDAIMDLENIMNNTKHPIHNNPEHVAALRAVLGDINSDFRNIPGSSVSKHRMGLMRYLRGIERTREGEDHWLDIVKFGALANDPPEGMDPRVHAAPSGAQPEEMRFVVDLLKGKYDPNKKIFNARPNHDTNPTDEVPVYGNSQK